MFFSCKNSVHFSSAENYEFHSTPVTFVECVGARMLLQQALQQHVLWKKNKGENQQCLTILNAAVREGNVHKH